MPPRILFADDSPDDRFLMLEAAKAAGLTDDFVVFADGDEAVSYLEKIPAEGAPTLAILDLSMPRMSGLETLDWIRRSTRHGTLPVFILTASANQGDLRAAYRRGANAYMTKPTTISELIELVAAMKAFWLRFVEAPPPS